MTLGPDPVRSRAPAMHGDRSVVLSGNLLGMASMMTWAAGFPAAEILLQSWPPLTLITTRLAVAVAMLVSIWLWLDGPRRVLSQRWGRAIWVGGIGSGIGAYLLLLAQVLTDPVTVALIASCAPMVGAALELFERTRRPTWRFALGVAASIAGGLVATSALAPAQLGAGALCAVLATVFFTWASMVIAREFRHLPVAGRGAISLAGGLVAMIAVSGLAFVADFNLLPRPPVDSRQIGMLLIYACVSTGISQALFIASVSKLGVTVASFHVNIAPFYVMIIMMMLGEGWHWVQAAGAAIVALGMVLAQGRSDAQPSASSDDGMIRKNTPDDQMPNQLSRWVPNSTSR